ncbi:MAG: glycosyltransferase family 4 protein [Acidilobus sp.]
MESIRIALVSDWFLPRVGGVEVSIRELAAELGRQGMEVFVITTSRGENDGRGPLESSEEYTVYRAPSLLNGPDGVTVDPLAVARSLLFIKRNAFDLVHSHGVSSTLSLLTSMIAAGGTGVPTILTNHSLLSDSLVWPASYLLRYALRWPRALTGVSRAAARDIERISGRKASVTPNCINVRAWIESARPLELEGDPTIIITSRLSRRKNPLEIAMVAEELVKRMPRARLYVIGDGLLGPELKRQLSYRGLGGYVKLLGVRPREEVAGLIASADFFVLTSRRESFGLAVLESMALGTVPIVYESPGVTDLVLNGVNGFIVNDPKSLVERLQEAYETDGLYARLSNEASRTAERFDCERVVRDIILPLYRDVIDRCEVDDRRFLAYTIYRRLTGDPVVRGEWCKGRKWLYHERAKEGIVPIVRRRA